MEGQSARRREGWPGPVSPFLWAALSMGTLAASSRDQPAGGSPSLNICVDSVLRKARRTKGGPWSPGEEG